MYLLSLVYCRDKTWEQPNERDIRTRYGGRGCTWAFQALLRHITLPEPPRGQLPSLPALHPRPLWFATPCHQAPLSVGFSGQECHYSLFQGIFPTQGSNPSLYHCRLFFFFNYLSHQGSPCWTSGVIVTFLVSLLTLQGELVMLCH